MNKLLSAEEYRNKGYFAKDFSAEAFAESYANYKARWIIESISEEEIDERYPYPKTDEPTPGWEIGIGGDGAKWARAELLRRLKSTEIK